MPTSDTLGRLQAQLQRLELWCQDRATRGFAWLYRRPVEGKRTYETVNGDEFEAYLFSKKTALWGQHTPFGTVLLNDHLLSDVSAATEDHVVHHEVSHGNRNSVIQGLWWGLILSMAVGIAYGLYGAGLILLGVPVGTLTELFAFCTVLIVSGVVVNRLEETKAELDALHAIGESDFRAAHDEIRTVSEPSIVGTVLGKLFYPHPETTISLYNGLQRFGFYQS